MEYKSPLAMLYHWETTAPDVVYLKQPIEMFGTHGRGAKLLKK